MTGTLPRIKVPGSSREPVVITRLAFGCARIFGGLETRASARLIETALEMGVRHFDTAPSYGDGRSEYVLGAVLAGVTDATIATKVGIPRPPSRFRPTQTLYRLALRPALAQFPGIRARLLARTTASPVLTQPVEMVPRAQLSRDEILRNLDESLRRLRRAHVDMYLLHEPDMFANWEDILEVFGDLQRSGVIRRHGLAWGRAVSAPLPLVDVVQSKIGAAVPEDECLEVMRVFHGVLRAGIDRDGVDLATKPRDRVQRILSKFPRACVLFSASRAVQIRELCDDIPSGETLSVACDPSEKV